MAMPLPLLAADSEQPAPNILLLLADDMGLNDSGIYQTDFEQPPVMSLPALEELAEQGVRYTRFYTESTCSSSRAALLTGQYPARHGFTPVARGLSPDVLTLAEFLQQQGYVTHHVGKWHLGEINPAAFPAQQGFDSSFGFLGQWFLKGPDKQGNKRLKAPTYYDPWLEDERGNYRQYEGHLTDILADHSVELIGNADKTQPWFIYHAFYAPHTPLQPAQRYQEMFPDTKAGRYQALLASLDGATAKMLRALQESGQWENTLIIFASDNGALAKHVDSNAPFGGGKNSYDEGGIRAPLVIKWPYQTEGGESVSRVVSIMDIYPSISDLLDAEVSDERGEEVLFDGKAALLPDSHKQHDSLKHLTFGALSVFDRDKEHRLVREWSGQSFTREEVFYYNEKTEVWPLPRSDESEQKDWEKTQQHLFGDFADWRREVRKVPVVKEQSKDDKEQVVITGSDFLRTPVNPAFAVSFSFVPPEGNQQKSKQQIVLLEQSEVLSALYDGNTQSLQAQVHGITVSIDKLEPGQCYNVVLSGEFYDRYSSVKNITRASFLHLLINGEVVAFNNGEIESLAEIDISAPTFADKEAKDVSFYAGQLLPHDLPVAYEADSCRK